MRRPSFFGATLAALASLAGSSAARGQLEYHAEPARAAFPIRHAAPPHAPPAAPSGAGPIAQDSGGANSLHHHHGGDWSGGGLGGNAFPFSGGYPWYAPGYLSPAWYYFAAPPLFVPANGLFGPQAAGPFLGWNNPAPLASPNRLAPAAPRVVKAPAANHKARGVGGFGELADDGAKRPERPKVRKSNAEAAARARQFVAFGDEHFHTQQYSDAYQRYKKAASAAPDLADAYFRQGFSLLAMGRYAPAARAFKHGLSLKPDWAKSTFRLDDLYGDNQLAKVAHLEHLATEATEHPQNPDLMFLLGIGLYIDGQAERARAFFERAAELGIDRQSVAGFLKVVPAPVAGEPARGREL